MKRKLSIALTFALLTTVMPLQALAITEYDVDSVIAMPDSPFTDVEVLPMPDSSDVNDWEAYYQAFGTIMFTYHLEKNLFDSLQGYEAEDGSRYFAPNNTVNRAEAAKFFYAYSKVNNILVNSGAIDFSEMFADKVPVWAETYVWALKDQGVIQGYSDGTYRPENTLNNAEIFKFLYKVYIDGDVTETGYDTWYAGYQAALEEANLIPEGLSPNAAPTRGEMAGYMMRGYIMYRMETDAFSDYQTALFVEKMLFSDENLIPFIYVGGDLELSDATDGTDDDYTLETIVLTNNGSEAYDLDGLTLRFNDDEGEEKGLEYVFGEGESLDAGSSIMIYLGEGGDYSFGAEADDSSFGLVDHIYGEYRYMLYNRAYEMLDVYAFGTP